MRCSFCFSDNQRGETCTVCGSPLRGLGPQKVVADSASSTRWNEKTVRLPANRALLSTLKTKQVAPEAALTSPELTSPEPQLIARRQFDDTLLAAAFWPQNRRNDGIALVTRDGTLQLWNSSSDTLQTISTPRARTASACNLAAFCAAHQRIVLAFENGAIELHETTRGASSNGTSSTRLLENGAKITSLAMTKNADILAAALEDGTIRLWDLSSIDSAPTIVDLCGLHRVAIAPDASWLAVGDDSGQVQVWNLQSQPLMNAQSLGTQSLGTQWRFEAHRLWVSALAFSPNAQMLASGGYDGTVRLYASQNGFEMARFPTTQNNSDIDNRSRANDRDDNGDHTNRNVIGARTDIGGAVCALCFVGDRFVAIAFAQGLALLDVWTGTTTPFAPLSLATHLAASDDGARLLALCRNEVSLFHLPDSLP